MNASVDMTCLGGSNNHSLSAKLSIQIFKISSVDGRTQGQCIHMSGAEHDVIERRQVGLTIIIVSGLPSSCPFRVLVKPSVMENPGWSFLAFGYSEQSS